MKTAQSRQMRCTVHIALTFPCITRASVGISLARPYIAVPCQRLLWAVERAWSQWVETNELPSTYQRQQGGGGRAPQCSLPAPTVVLPASF
jgi:hypothetical protein